MKVETIATKYGKIKHFKTREAGFNIETIKPKKGFKCYLKRNIGIIYVLKGKAKLNNKVIKKGDIIKFKPKQRIKVQNIYNKPFIYLGIDIPPARKDDII